MAMSRETPHRLYICVGSSPALRIKLRIENGGAAFKCSLRNWDGMS